MILAFLLALELLTTALEPPKTPAGLEPCKRGIAVKGSLPKRLGEVLRYNIELNGLAVGTVDFKIEKLGLYDGHAAIEYRSLFQIDSLLANFLPANGRAAALVGQESNLPLIAMDNYLMNKDQWQENLSFSLQATEVKSRRQKNEQIFNDQRQFTYAIYDFVSAFYALRRADLSNPGCQVLYGNQRAYTFWLFPDGEERVKTPVGWRLAERWAIKYGTDKGKKIYQGKLWMSKTGERVPYQAEIYEPKPVKAYLHLFDPGIKEVN